MPLPTMLRSLRAVVRLKPHSKRLCYTGAFGSAIYAAYLYGNASPSKPTITHTLFSQFTAKCAWNQTAGFELQETLSSFIKYLQDINNQKQLSSSMVQEIWDELSTNLPLATEHDLSSLLSQDEINEVIDDPCLFQIMADRRKEITNLKQEANKLLKDVLNKIETDNDEHESLKNQMFHYSPMFHRKRIQKPIRCLVIDGGGLRGCLSITILKQLEKKAREQSGNTNIKICDLFDFIVGTSTGGLIAIGLGIKKWDTERINTFYNKVAVDVFKAKADQIDDPPERGFFGNAWKSTKKGVWFAWNAIKYVRSSESARYDENKLIKCFTDDEAKGGAGIKQDRYMCDGKQINKPFVALVAVENTNPTASYPVLLRNYGNDPKGYVDYTKDNKLGRLPGISKITICQAARATSAAPTYLKSVRVHVDGRDKPFHLIDGGLNANTPALLAWAEASKLWPDREIFMYSVGTGNPQVDNNDDSINKTKGVLSIAKMAFHSYQSEMAQKFALRIMACIDRLDLFHSWPEIDKDSTEMDDWTCMKYWRDVGDKYVSKKKSHAKMNQMAKFLLKYRRDETGEDIFEEAYMNIG
eukprot:471884_1